MCLLLGSSRKLGHCVRHISRPGVTNAALRATTNRPDTATRTFEVVVLSVVRISAIRSNSAREDPPALLCHLLTSRDIHFWGKVLITSKIVPQPFFLYGSPRHILKLEKNLLKIYAISIKGTICHAILLMRYKYNHNKIKLSVFYSTEHKQRAL